ncbi:DM9 repeat-containing protein [Actinoplanes sp. NPDC049316]|uniref:DM9 repeat-containing protein n=1 Tax=Actinoplanes sp. NPDC049316 TaxID=3154727 RepID=UPI0034228D55
METFPDENDGYRWQPATNGRIPHGATPHGYEENGDPLWVCRAPAHGGVHPGKVRPGFGVAAIAWAGGELACDEYEVLMDRGIWGVASGGDVPADAYEAGRDSNGEPLFVARAALGAGNLHIGKLRREFGAANIGYGGQEHKIHAYEVLLSPIPRERSGVPMPPTYADFGTAPARTANASLDVRGVVAATDHLKLNAGGFVELEFDVPSPTTAQEVTLGIVALASMRGPDAGFAPLDVTVNGRSLVDRWRIPNNGGLPQHMQFAIPADRLRPGANRVRVASADDALTMMWLYRLTLDPMHTHGRSARILREQEAAEPVLRYATRRDTGQPGPDVTVFVDRGELSLPEQLAWAQQDGTEYAVTFAAAMHEFYGWCRTRGGEPQEFRGDLVGRWSADHPAAPVARRFETEEGWGGGWHPSGPLVLAVGEDGGEPTRVSWRDKLGNSGTIAVTDGGAGFLGTYQRAGEGPIGYRSR